MSISRQQITLLFIFALFLGPVILVVMMRASWWQYQPAELKNHGYLVQPPVQLPLEESPAIARKWLILYKLAPLCEQKCIERITSLRQIHLAAGKNREHLAVILLSRSTPDSVQKVRLEAIYPEFIWITDKQTEATDRLAAIDQSIVDDSGHAIAVHTYILDPMLNVILAYGTDSDPNDIHKDLKRLLKWSDQENTQ